MHTKFQSENFAGRRYFEDLVGNGGIILKRIIKKQNVRVLLAFM
jgi:hypothetical protein